MDHNPPEKHGSFSGNHDNKIITTGSDDNVLHDHQKQDHDQETLPVPELSLPQALEDVDRFIETAAAAGGEWNVPEIPGTVETFLKTTEKTISEYDSNVKFAQDQEKDELFIKSLIRISKMANVLESVVSSNNSNTLTSCLNRASTAVHLAMSFLDSEFRGILETCLNNNNSVGESQKKNPKTTSKQSSFSISHQESERIVASGPEGTTDDEEFPGYSPEAISNLNRIATAMISSGYEKECCMVYGSVRRKAFDRELAKLGFANTSFEDVHRMQWQSLEGEISTWITVIKHCSSVLFIAEGKLCQSVFLEHPSVAQRQFEELASVIIMRFLNFAEAIVLTKRSTEKLFKFLDMYETIQNLIPMIEENCSNEAKSETWAAKSHLREAAVSSFFDLENSIKRDNGKTPVPSGAVHPLTRYTMNYLKYACEYRDTLEQVLQQHQKMEGSEASNSQDVEFKEGANEDGTPKTSPFSVQLSMVMDLLDENLDMKSNLYKDPALKFIFLMNNGRYILQKIKGSKEIHDMMGVNWCRKRSTALRQYHKGYTRETWSRLLQCLSHEGLQVNGKVAKPLVKERFKMFNSTFDEIHKTQSTWVVCDEQLQSELRVSVSAVVIPAYRSFVGRFQQYLSSGRQSEKYIKYQPEDIENLIDDLFSGNPTSMARRRT